MADEINQETIEQINQLEDRFGLVNKTLLNFSGIIRKSAKSFEEQIKDLNEELDDAQKAYKVSTNEQQQEHLRKKVRAKAEEKQAVQLARVKEEFGEALGKATVQLTAGLIGSVQDNASAVKISSKVMTTGIGLAGSGLTAVGTGLQALGGAALATALVIPPLGIGLAALTYATGTLIKGFAAAATALGQFAVEALAKELEKTIVAFGKASAGGALFADGMTGLRDAAKNAGLTIEQFSETIQRQSANIAAAGLSVPQGVKRLGNALRAGGDELRGNLINLGFSIAEQGDLVAETMALMRQSGQPLQANGTQIAVQTERYAENLRVIAAITGEDAKKKMAQTREITNQLAFQQKLAGMDEDQRIKIINGMANMPAALQKNVRDIVLFGSVINTTGATLTALSPNIQGLQNSIASQVTAGTLNADSARMATKQFNAGIRAELADQNGAFSSIALAQSAGISGLASDVGALATDLLVQVAPDKAAITAAEEAVRNQKKTTDELTANVKSASIAAQGLATALQDSLLKPMSLFAEATKGVTEGMKLAVDELYRLTGVENPGFSSSSFDGEKTVRENLGIKSMDTGGIATGPVSGYAATLHGTEAVVPLPDGKNIPVNLDTSSITTALQHQTATISELLRAQQQSNQLTSQLLSVSV